MVQRRGGIKSKLFNSSSGRRESPSESTVFKGDSHHSSNSTDVVKISFTKVENGLKQLALISSTKVDDLSEEMSQLYTQVVQLLSADGAAKHSAEIFLMVDRIFAPYAPFQPDTVGANIAGCLHNDNFPTPECSAVCAGSAQPNVPGSQTCSQNVIHWDNGKMTLVSKNPKSNSAYVFIINGNFKGFTSTQVSDLQKEGISYVTVKSVGSKDYTVVSAEVPLSNLPIIPEPGANAGNGKPGSKPHNSSGGGSGYDNDSWSAGAVILWIIIFIIIICLLIWGASKMMKGRSQAQMASESMSPAADGYTGMYGRGYSGWGGY